MGGRGDPLHFNRRGWGGTPNLPPYFPRSVPLNCACFPCSDLIWAGTLCPVDQLFPRPWLRILARCSIGDARSLVRRPLAGILLATVAVQFPTQPSSSSPPLPPSSSSTHLSF